MTFKQIALILLLPACSSNDASSADAARDAPGTDNNTGDSVSAACQRQVFEGEVTNARDVAGVKISGGEIACSKLLRGGHLGGLTDGGCTELAKLGIKTVIDLRAEGAQQSEPPHDCVTKQAAIVSAAMPKLLPPTADNYLALLKEKDAIAAMFEAIGKAAAAPFYVHCVIGRDRASFATALLLLSAGASRQDVVDEFLLSNTAGVTVQQGWIEAVLDEIDKLGGIENFLESIGVKKTQTEAFREQLL